MVIVQSVVSNLENYYARWPHANLHSSSFTPHNPLLPLFYKIKLSSFINAWKRRKTFSFLRKYLFFLHTCQGSLEGNACYNLSCVAKCLCMFGLDVYTGRINQERSLIYGFVRNLLLWVFFFIFYSVSLPSFSCFLDAWESNQTAWNLLSFNSNLIPILPPTRFSLYRLSHQSLINI